MNRKQFVVDLVSYGGAYTSVSNEMKEDEAYIAALDVIKETEADCVVFGGGLLCDNRQLNRLRKDIVELCLNKEVVVVVEVMCDSNHVKRVSGRMNCIHVLYCKNGLVYDRNNVIPQLFAESQELKNGVERKELMQKMYMKMASNIFMVKGRRCCVIQCGEINFLEGRDVEGVRVRGCKSDDYVEEINMLVERDVDVFFDVIHTPMGEQGAVQAKLAWLSGNKRSCFAVCNSGYLVSSLEELSSLQYVFKDGDNVSNNGKIVVSKDEYIVRRFRV